MPEIRRDPVLGKQVIIAVERGKRPTDLSQKEENTIMDYVEKCPFCAGNEEQTPPELTRIEKDNQWVIRVIPNKFPALSMDSKCEDVQSELYFKQNGIGYHEVIVESRSHSKSFFNMNKEDFEHILKIYTERYRELIKLEGIKYVSVFKNHKRKAGASLEHPHSQVMAIPLVPNLIDDEIKGSKNYFDKKGTCIYCDIIKKETKNGERLIAETENFIVLAPYASVYNYETVIAPKNHLVNFEKINDELLKELAEVLQKVFYKMGRLLGDFPFNMYIHTLPKGYDVHKKNYHWHIVIGPRLSTQAGFEVGSGVYINTVSPEDAAKSLREIND